MTIDTIEGDKTKKCFICGHYNFIMPSQLWFKGEKRSICSNDCAKQLIKMEDELKIEASEERDKKYSELLMAVCRKILNESRHETALRYIREGEEQDNVAVAEQISRNPEK